MLLLASRSRGSSPRISPAQKWALRLANCVIHALSSKENPESLGLAEFLVLDWAKRREVSICAAIGGSIGVRKSGVVPTRRPRLRRRRDIIPINIAELQLPSPLVAAVVSALIKARLRIYVVSLVQTLSCFSTLSIWIRLKVIRKWGFTLCVVVIAKVVVKNEILDALLFLFLGLLLAAHCNSESGVRR